MKISLVSRFSIIHYLLIIIVSLVVPTSIFSSINKKYDPYQLLKQSLIDIKTLQAQFHQTTTSSKGQSLQMTKGTMIIKRFSQFRWHIQEPFPQLLISNGKKIWNYDVNLKQVSIRFIDQKNIIPAAILGNNINQLAQDYILTVHHYSKEQVFTFIPKNSNSIFKSLQLNLTHNQLKSMKNYRFTRSSYYNLF